MDKKYNISRGGFEWEILDGALVDKNTFKFIYIYMPFGGQSNHLWVNMSLFTALLIRVQRVIGNQTKPGLCATFIIYF